jgi:flagellar M-ring protein FliF
MATVPATQAEAGTLPAPRRRGMFQSDFLEGLANLNIFRQLGLMLGLAASVAIGVAAVLWSQGSDYRPLYGSLGRLDSSAVLELLDSNKIKYKLDSGTGALLVEADRIHDARLKLAEAGVPGDRSVGFELLDKEQPLGTSQFMETARYRRSLEGELARTIASITSVRSARVHLAIPKESVFIRDARPASASVFIELFPGATLQAAQVKSIINLVAGSISELKPENVTVVDQRGTLLSQLVLDEPNLAMANRQLEYGNRIERRLLERVNSILEPLLGAGKFRAEVSADVDFTAVEQADEIYNPDLPAIRSEQRLQEDRSGSAVAGIPGALSNQPPVDGIAPEQVAGQPNPAQGTGPSAQLTTGGAAGGGGRSREQVVRNYELDRTLSYTKHQVGKVRRLTVAVAIDDRAPVAAVGGAEPTAVPWDAEQLERLAILVRNAVGYDAARGDIVNVVNSPFVAVAPIDTEELPWWQQPWARLLLDNLKPLLGLLVALVVIFGVLRPVMKSLSLSSRESKALDGPPLGDLGEAMMGPLGDEKVTLSGSGSMMLPKPTDSYEEQLTAIRGLIAEDPGRVAQVVKKWVATSE